MNEIFCFPFPQQDKMIETHVTLDGSVYKVSAFAVF